jgi:hypothetical protein
LLTSILLSQTFLAEIFSYTQKPAKLPVRIASAAADPYPLWGGKDAYTVSNHPGAGYQALFPVTWKAGMKTDFSDIRFSDGSGNIIPYWIESKTDSASAQVWIKLTASSTVNMHYGNAAAASESNGVNVFDAFDDFNSWNSTLWGAQPAVVTLSGGKVTLANATLQLNQDSGSVMCLRFMGKERLRALLCSVFIRIMITKHQSISPLPTSGCGTIPRPILRATPISRPGIRITTFSGSIVLLLPC